MEKKIKFAHDKESGDSEEIVDWEWVYSQPKWVRDGITSGKDVYVKKTKKRK